MIHMKVRLETAFELATRIIGQTDAGKHVAAALSVRAAAACKTSLMLCCHGALTRSRRRLLRFLARCAEAEAASCSVERLCWAWRWRWFACYASSSDGWLFGYDGCPFHGAVLPRPVGRIAQPSPICLTQGSAARRQSRRRHASFRTTALVRAAFGSRCVSRVRQPCLASRCCCSGRSVRRKLAELGDRRAGRQIP